MNAVECEMILDFILRPAQVRLLARQLHQLWVEATRSRRSDEQPARVQRLAARRRVSQNLGHGGGPRLVRGAAT